MPNTMNEYSDRLVFNYIENGYNLKPMYHVVDKTSTAKGEMLGTIIWERDRWWFKSNYGWLDVSSMTKIASYMNKIPV